MVPQHQILLGGVASVAALALTVLVPWLFRKIKSYSQGTERMQEISGLIRQGSKTFMYQQYRVIMIVFIAASLGLFVLNRFGLQSIFAPIAVPFGGFFSGLAGYIGMMAATLTAVRVAEAARHSLKNSFIIAMLGGSVLGIVVVGFVLLDIALWLVILDWFIADSLDKWSEITTIMLSFGMGASLQALFSRLGGGIYTKAADMAADLTAKTEFNIPEDDPRNPAVIADNVGDNVGDIAGMGADLYESLASTILAVMVLGAAYQRLAGPEMQMKYILLPLLAILSGFIFSIIAVFLINPKENSEMKELVRSTNNKLWIISGLIALSIPLICQLLGLDNWLKLTVVAVLGLASGIILGESTNYFTSYAYRPTKFLAESAKISPATVIIEGMSLGMISGLVPVIAICAVMALSYKLMFDGTIISGLYGIGFSAVCMLAPLTWVLTNDGFGPIADNAGGNAEMSDMPKDVRKRTDILDAVGNTAAAIGKGFAIGSAALTVMVLLVAYLEQVRASLLTTGQKTIQLVSGRIVDVSTADILDFVDYYQINVMNIKFLFGVFIGAMVVLVFSGLVFRSVGGVANRLVEEIRRQFANSGIMQGIVSPDYDRCILVTTKGAQKGMILPALLGLIVPALVGLLFGVPGIMGLLLSAMAIGFPLAIFMGNAGGAWDNAKKYIEIGHFGGKGSDAHKAAVVGDTVGDPCKDTVGPSLDILIKLMSIVAIVLVGLHI